MTERSNIDAQAGELQQYKDELDRLRGAIDDIRDSVLHDRHQLAEAGLDSDQTNAVLGIIDDAILTEHAERN